MGGTEGHAAAPLTAAEFQGLADDLSGALGGMGGQSAFGTKAGDVFTKVTVGTAVVWILLAMAAVKFIIPSHNALMKADWRPRYAANPSRLLYGKTVLILGYRIYGGGF